MKTQTSTLSSGSEVIALWSTSLSISAKFDPGLQSGLNDLRQAVGRGPSRGPRLDTSLNRAIRALEDTKIAIEMQTDAPALNMKKNLPVILDLLRKWEAQAQAQPQRPWCSSAHLVPQKGRLAGRSGLAAFAFVVGATASLIDAERGGLAGIKVKKRLAESNLSHRFVSALRDDPVFEKLKPLLTRHSAVVAQSFLQGIEADSRTPWTRFLDPVVRAATGIVKRGETPCLDLNWLLKSNDNIYSSLNGKKSRCAETMLIIARYITG